MDSSLTSMLLSILGEEDLDKLCNLCWWVVDLEKGREKEGGRERERKRESTMYVCERKRHTFKELT